METFLRYMLFAVLCLTLAGCDNTAEQAEQKAKEDASRKVVDDEIRRLEASTLDHVVERMEITQGSIAASQARLDMLRGGAVFEIKNAACGAAVYVDGHPAGTVHGCDKSTRFGQTEVSPSDFILSLAPKKDKQPYKLTIKKKGYKTFEQELMQGEVTKKLIEVDAAMPKE